MNSNKCDHIIIKFELPRAEIFNETILKQFHPNIVLEECTFNTWSVKSQNPRLVLLSTSSTQRDDIPRNTTMGDWVCGHYIIPASRRRIYTEIYKSTCGSATNIRWLLQNRTISTSITESNYLHFVLKHRLPHPFSRMWRQNDLSSYRYYNSSYMDPRLFKCS